MFGPSQGHAKVQCHCSLPRYCTIPLLLLTNVSELLGVQLWKYGIQALVFCSKCSEWSVVRRSPCFDSLSSTLHRNWWIDCCRCCTDWLWKDLGVLATAHQAWYAAVHMVALGWNCFNALIEAHNGPASSWKWWWSGWICCSSLSLKITCPCFVACPTCFWNPKPSALEARTANILSADCTGTWSKVCHLCHQVPVCMSDKMIVTWLYTCFHTADVLFSDFIHRLWHIQVAPTRELALQIQREANTFCKASQIFWG